MTTLILTSEFENRKKEVNMNFSKAKRIQWNRYRRYGF